MNCETWRSELDAYADGELSTESSKKLEQHLESCPTCTGEALRRVQLKRMVHTAGQRYAPSAALRERVQKQIAPRRAPWRAMWFALAASAAVIAIVIASAGLWIRNTQREQVLAQLTDMHVSALASVNRVDVISSDRHTVKPWFQGKLPFTFDLPELAGSPYTLLGGRVAYMGHSPGAHLLFELRKHEISVFIFPETVAGKALSSRSTVAKRLNFNLETWSQDGLRYFIVGDASPADIEGLSRLLKRPS